MAHIEFRSYFALELPQGNLGEKGLQFAFQLCPKDFSQTKGYQLTTVRQSWILSDCQDMLLSDILSRCVLFLYLISTNLSVASLQGTWQSPIFGFTKW